MLQNENDHPLTKREADLLATDLKSANAWGLDLVKQELAKLHEVQRRSRRATLRGNYAMYLCLALLVYVAYKLTI